MGIFRILFYSIGNLFWGVLLTVIGIVLLFYIIKSWRRDSTFTPISFCVGVFLFFFLAFQSVLLCGAVTIKSCADDIHGFIENIVCNIPSERVFTTEDSQEILNEIGEEYPIVGYYLNLADFQGHTPLDIADSMVTEMNSYMNWFILRRVGWSCLFILIGVVVILKTLDTFGHSSHRTNSIRGRGHSRTSRTRFYDD